MQTILSARFHESPHSFQNLVAVPGLLLKGSDKVTHCSILLVIQVNLHTLMMFLLQLGTFQLGLIIKGVQGLLEVLKFFCK